MDGEAFGREVVDIVRGYVEREVTPLRAENEELKARIKALEDRPAPEVLKGEPGERGEDGAKGEDGKDGRGIADLIIDREGNLIATMDDGSTKNLGPVVGKDGTNGIDGKDGLQGEPGFNLEDFDIERGTDGRTFIFKFERGDTRHEYELTFPVIIDAGVYKEGEAYVPGDAVTWGGSLWIAQRATTSKPDSADSGWRLAVKRGRDGKDAKPNG